LKSEEKTRKQGLERIRKSLPSDLETVRQTHTPGGRGGGRGPVAGGAQGRSGRGAEGLDRLGRTASGPGANSPRWMANWRRKRSRANCGGRR
jgi:hypothetical protein